MTTVFSRFREPNAAAQRLSCWNDPEISLVQRSRRDIENELLALRCRRGDGGAWEQLVRTWERPLMYYIRRLVSDEAAAWCILQDVWLKALRGIRSLRDNDRLAPWLYSIARNTAMSHLRGRYSDREESEQLVADEPDQQDAVEQFDDAELVHYGLQQIGIMEREALVLFFLQDLSIGEIAGVLEIPEGTVKSRLSRARRQLRQVLQREQRYV